MLTRTRPDGLAGAFAPPALKGVDNPTFAHRPLARPVDKQGYPHRALPPSFKSFFPFLLVKHSRGEPLPKDSGGAASPTGDWGRSPLPWEPFRAARDALGVLFAPLWGAFIFPAFEPVHQGDHRQEKDAHCEDLKRCCVHVLMSFLCGFACESASISIGYHEGHACNPRQCVSVIN